MKFRSIIDKVAEDRIDEALTTFEIFFDDIAEIKEQLILTRGNYRSIQRQEIDNVEDPEDIARDKNKVRKSIVDLFAQVESLTENGSSSSKGQSANQVDTVESIVQNALSDRGYEIITQILSDQSSYYYKAKKNSFVQKDYYVIQVLNRYKLNNSRSGYNQTYLDFFSRCPRPFVDLMEFHPGNPSYIIRKFAEGIDANTLIKSGMSLSLLKSLDVIITVAKGLQEIDEAKIFYNNLIPDQIILDNNLDLHLLPLNIFEDNDHVTTWKNLKDGIKFMSPEQLTAAGNRQAQEQLTVVSNQFSLGLILFYIFAGEPLFDGKGLPDLYEDRIDSKDTNSQLTSFYEKFKESLLQYGIEEDEAKEMLGEFRNIFKKLIRVKPENRFQRFGDFISKIEFLKLRIEHKRNDLLGKYLDYTNSSFYRAIRVEDELISKFYDELISQLTSKKSMDDVLERNIRLQYALNYVFSSVSDFDNQAFMVEALSCLVKGQHFDFTIEDYEVFFKLLKEHISKSDPDWSVIVEESWDHFMDASLNAIDTILHPSLNLTEEA